MGLERSGPDLQPQPVIHLQRANLSATQPRQQPYSAQLQWRVKRWQPVNRHPLKQARPQDWQHRAKVKQPASRHYRPPTERAGQHWKGQVQCAFFQVTPAARIRNPGAHYGERPISVPGPSRHNRPAPIGCGNTRSRSRYKCVVRVPPCRIEASGKCQCLRRDFAARDDRAAYSAQPLGQSKRT